MTINFVKTSQTAKTPTSGSAYSAGYDLYADISTPALIPAHTTLKIDTSIALEIPKGYFGAVYARSGISAKRGLRPSNCVGIIDSDYRGSVCVALHNDSDSTTQVEPDERIAQLVIQKYLPIKFKEVATLNKTKRGKGGFGSTGQN